MKRFARFMLILIVLGSGFSFLQAASKAKTPEQRAQMVEKQVDHLTKKLKLTSDQATQLRTILQDKIDKQQQAIDEANSKIRPLLTPEQLRKFDDFTD